MSKRVVLLMFALNLIVVLGGLFANYKFNRPVAQGTPSEAVVVQEVRAEGVEYLFVPVDKVLVSLHGADREHYVVLDLVLQADRDADKKKIEQVDPMVRSSVVSKLSGLSFEEVRAMQVPQLQQTLEKDLFADFVSHKVAIPFEHVLISKILVQ